MRLGLKVALAAVMAAGLSSAARADGDAEKGAKQFSICKACHAVGEDAKVKVGPPLNNIVGRVAGTYEGAEKTYSKLMKDAGENGLQWTEEAIDKYLADPTDFLISFLKEKGKDDLATGKSKMVLKTKQDAKRANIIAYLKTLSNQ